MTEQVRAAAERGFEQWVDSYYGKNMRSANASTFEYLNFVWKN